MMTTLIAVDSARSNQVMAHFCCRILAETVVVQIVFIICHTTIRQSAKYSYTAQAKNLYDIAQYHDYTGYLDNDVILDSSAKSVFEANKYKSPDYNTNLTEVGIQTSTPNETDVISIYVNNSPYPSSVATTSQDFTGFHVVKLPLPVNLQPNTKYSVVVEKRNQIGNIKIPIDKPYLTKIFGLIYINKFVLNPKESYIGTSIYRLQDT